MKVLYFEGAGWSDADISKETIGNCRIRTAFHLDDGRRVYLEIGAKQQPKSRRNTADICPWKYTGFVQSCHYITDDMPNDDETKHRIRLMEHNRVFEYVEASILKFVNSLGASFDAVKIVPDLGGFRVFQWDSGRDGLHKYNYGDDFLLDPKMLARRQAVYDRIYEIEKKEKKYPSFSMWVDAKDPGLLHLLRHFNNCNKHWSMRTDVGETVEDWLGTSKETLLGRYEC